MSGHITSNVVTTRVTNATAAGTSAVNGTGTNMAGFAACRAIALLGTLTASQVTSLKLQQSSDNGNLDAWADISGSQTGNAADADSNKLLITDKIKPTKQYVRTVVVRGTANAAVDGVILELYRAENQPVTQDSTVSQSLVS